MRWLISLVLALVMVSPAFAGEDPYIAIVGPDYQGNPFYFSPKHLQFMYNENLDPYNIPVTFGTIPAVTQYTRVGLAGQEMFRSQTYNGKVEVCDATDAARGLKGALTPAGNSGFYEWYIRLPKKPSGEINIVLQCGVLKPNSLAFWEERSIDLCAAETGERVGPGLCVRTEVEPGDNPLLIAALPKITAIAYPGPYAPFAWSPFNLTAFKNPGTYDIKFTGPNGAMVNDSAAQILNGTTSSRILLKACMDKTVVAKLPVTGQLNVLNQEEVDLEMGDMIYVRLDVPRPNSVDIYCHAQSVRIAGIGEAP